MRILPYVLVTALLPFAASCSMVSEPDAPSPPQHTGFVADHFMHPRGDLITAGQPAPEDWLRLRGRHVTTVINLRTDEEMEGRDEAAEVAAAGLDYQRLPIADEADIDAAHADKLWQRIDAAPGRVMVHCASGNRVGALLAIGAARHGDMSPQQALEFGQRAGLTSLEPKVREVLGLPPMATETR